MKKELKQIFVIAAFILIGCMLGSCVAAVQADQRRDPAYLAFWSSKNMPVPEPLGVSKSMLSFGLLFSGIPTGLIFYNGIAQKWLTPMAPKILLGVIAFPIYTLAGVIGSIPFLLYQSVVLLRRNK
ncbi:MAG: hypothetical protein MR286_05740 [Clostridiales bacterium]|nr:hypothetical protein [Clostridiales bacterium]